MTERNTLANLFGSLRFARQIFLMKNSIIFVCLIWSVAMAQAESLVAPGARLEKLAGGLAFAEGPTVNRAGQIFFTDQPNDRILKWDESEQLSTFMQPAGRANGLMFDANGNLIACAETANRLIAIAPNKSITVLVSNVTGAYLNAPNDLWIAPNGGIYFTDPIYRRSWANTNLTRVAGEYVYFLSSNRQAVRAVITDFQKPNGLTGTPDGRTLYATDIRADKTWRYDIKPDGSLTNKTLFCSKGADGMTLDSLGNVYLCANGLTKGVSIYSPTGELIERLAVPEPWTANVSFGGADHRTLFITASRSLYAIRLRVAGGNPSK